MASAPDAGRPFATPLFRCMGRPRGARMQHRRGHRALLRRRVPRAARRHGGGAAERPRGRDSGAIAVDDGFLLCPARAAGQGRPVGSQYPPRRQHAGTLHAGAGRAGRTAHPVRGRGAVAHAALPRPCRYARRAGIPIPARRRRTVASTHGAPVAGPLAPRPCSLAPTGSARRAGGHPGHRRVGQEHGGGDPAKVRRGGWRQRKSPGGTAVPPRASFRVFSTASMCCGAPSSSPREC